MPRVRSVWALVIAALTMAFGPIATVAHADPTEVQETFVATGTWNVTTCDQTTCQFAGHSTTCIEIETVGAVVNNGCRVQLIGALSSFLFGGNICNLALGGISGNVIATFIDGSEPNAQDVRVGTVVGGAAVAEGLVITSASTDLFNGVMTGAYPSLTCPLQAGTALTFTVTETGSVINP